MSEDDQWEERTTVAALSGGFYVRSDQSRGSTLDAPARAARPRRHKHADHSCRLTGDRPRSRRTHTRDGSSAETSNEDAVKIKVTSCGISDAADERTSEESALHCTRAGLLLLFSARLNSSLRVLSRELGRVLVVLRLVLFEQLRNFSSKRIVRVRKLKKLHDLLQHRAGRQGRGPEARKDASANSRQQEVSDGHGRDAASDWSRRSATTSATAATRAQKPARSLKNCHELSAQCAMKPAPATCVCVAVQRTTCP